MCIKKKEKEEKDKIEKRERQEWMRKIDDRNRKKRENEEKNRKVLGGERFKRGKYPQIFKFYDWGAHSFDHANMAEESNQFFINDLKSAWSFVRLNFLNLSNLYSFLSSDALSSLTFGNSSQREL